MLEGLDMINRAAIKESYLKVNNKFRKYLDDYEIKRTKHINTMSLTTHKEVIKIYAKKTIS